MEDVLKLFEFKNGAREYSSLALAFMGDAVFEVYVRSFVLSKGSKAVDKMNSEARNMVKAQAQAKMYHKIKNMLTGEELAVLKRGRNANSHTMAKHASATDYRHATGLEALFGYLYLQGRTDRLGELFLRCIEEE